MKRGNIKILIVEDDVMTADRLMKKIKDIGYTDISIAHSYDKAMEIIRQKKPSLILLDIELNDKYSGIDIANEKEVLNKIHIIYISGYKNSPIDSIVETKPITHLSKPVQNKDLEVAIFTAITLISNKRDDIVNIGHEFTYDFGKEKLFYKREPIKLSHNEQLLLKRLIEGEGEVVYFDELEFHVWGYEPRLKSSLRTLVWNLNRKLKCKKSPKKIENIQSFGYRLLLPKD